MFYVEYEKDNEYNDAYFDDCGFAWDFYDGCVEDGCESVRLYRSESICGRETYNEVIAEYPRDNSHEVAKAYQDFEKAMQNLIYAMNNDANDTVNKADGYPFEKSFDEYMPMVNDWVENILRRLDAKENQ